MYFWYLLVKIMQKKTIITFFFSILLTYGNSLKSQDLFRSFLDLGTPEKCWAITHPFIASFAYKLTKRVDNVTDSLEQVYADTTKCDDVWDAFRHCYWMALLSSRLRTKAVCKLGCAHEISSLKNYKNSMVEKGCLHDSIASYMDLHNNKVGLEIGRKHKNENPKKIIQKVFKSISRGKCVQVDRNSDGQFIDSTGAPIQQEELNHKWNTGRILETAVFKKTIKIE